MSARIPRTELWWESPRGYRLRIEGLYPQRRRDGSFSPARLDDKVGLDSYEAVARCVMDWLQGAPRTRCLRDVTSYFAKHAAEEAIREYVPNGVFIGAALALGVPAAMCEDGPNVFVGLCREWVESERDTSRAVNRVLLAQAARRR